MNYISSKHKTNSKLSKCINKPGIVWISWPRIGGRFQRQPSGLHGWCQNRFLHWWLWTGRPQPHGLQPSCCGLSCFTKTRRDKKKKVTFWLIILYCQDGSLAHTYIVPPAMPGFMYHWDHSLVQAPACSEFTNCIETILHGSLLNSTWYRGVEAWLFEVSTRLQQGRNIESQASTPRYQVLCLGQGYWDHGLFCAGHEDTPSKSFTILD